MVMGNLGDVISCLVIAPGVLACLMLVNVRKLGAVFDAACFSCMGFVPRVISSISSLLSLDQQP